MEVFLAIPLVVIGIVIAHRLDAEQPGHPRIVGYPSDVPPAQGPAGLLDAESNHLRDIVAGYGLLGQLCDAVWRDS